MLAEIVRKSITTSSLNIVLGILLTQQQLYGERYRLLQPDHNLKLPLNFDNYIACYTQSKNRVLILYNIIEMWNNWIGRFSYTIFSH